MLLLVSLLAGLLLLKKPSALRLVLLLLERVLHLLARKLLNQKQGEKLISSEDAQKITDTQVSKSTKSLIEKAPERNALKADKKLISEKQANLNSEAPHIEKNILIMEEEKPKEEQQPDEEEEK